MHCIAENKVCENVPKSRMLNKFLINLVNFVIAFINNDAIVRTEDGKNNM